jgi:hypothetical protein
MLENLQKKSMNDKLAKDKIQSVRNDKLMDIQKEIQNSNQ